MSASVQAVQLSQQPETETHSGVVCIFCGLPTPVQDSREGAAPRDVLCPNRRVMLVRCEVCGKEAPYRSYEVSAFGEMPFGHSSSVWFAKEAI
jgi:hypothetical protein